MAMIYDGSNFWRLWEEVFICRDFYSDVQNLEIQNIYFYLDHNI